MATAKITEEGSYNLSDKRRIDASINMIIDNLEDHVCLRMLYEYNQYRGKHEDFNVTFGGVLSRFTIMTFTDDKHEEHPPAEYISEVRKALELTTPNSVKTNSTYLPLLFVLRVFNDMCILCLDGKPILNGEFITIEEARFECNPTY